jgi:hypothetical protein
VTVPNGTDLPNGTLFYQQMSCWSWFASRRTGDNAKELCQNP